MWKKGNSVTKIKPHILLVYGFVILVTVLPRLYHLTSPVADWHSWRQADTAAVARNFLKSGIDPLHPKYDDLSNIQSGKDNPEGYRMVEFPLYQMAAALVAGKIPGVPVEVILRLLTIAAAAASAAMIVSLVGRRSGFVTGVLAGIIYAFLPYSIYYGRAILPEGIAVFFTLLALYFLDLSFPDEKTVRAGYFFASAVAAACSLLVKPTAGFFLLPIAVLILPRLFRRNLNLLMVIAYGFLSLFPLWWWRVWIQQFPEGIPASNWLLNDGNIRFKGAWFYWLFAERIGKLILGYWGLVPFGLGILTNPRKDRWYFPSWLAAVVLYFAVFARGNVQHDYYQILIIPTLAMGTAMGLTALIRLPHTNRMAAFGVAAVCMIFAGAFSWYTIRTYYWINRPEIVEAGKTADSLLPKDAKVIAPYNGDTTFLYQINRQGWPIGFDIPLKIDKGAGYYVTVSPTDADFETKELAEKYTVLVRNDRFAIIDLTRKK